MKRKMHVCSATLSTPAGNFMSVRKTEDLTAQLKKACSSRSPANAFLGALFAALMVTAAPDAQAGAIVGVDRSGNLYNVSPVDASLTLIGSTTLPIMAMEMAPNGTLYGWTVGQGGFNGELYTINPTTAEYTLVGPFNIPDLCIEGGLAISPSGTAYAAVNGTTGVGRFLFTINLQTGAATRGAKLSDELIDINGLLWRSDGKLVGIERVTNSLIQIDPLTGAISTIAVISDATLGAVGDMTMLDGISYFSTASTSGSGTNELFRFDPFTGAHERVGSFGINFADSGISGLAGVAVPEPSSEVSMLLCATLLVASTRRRVFETGHLPGAATPSCTSAVG
jgi:hypothetical protein